VAGAVVGEQRRHADRAREVLSRRHPAAPGVFLLARIEDADDGAPVAGADAEVATPPDVADERLDFEGRRKRPAREGLESGGVGRKQRS